LEFYKRSPELATDTATNDDFAYDFIKQIGGDVLIQMLPTSPFIDSKMIENFINVMISTEVETLISVNDIKIECVYKGVPINFDQKAHTPPSQLLSPVKAYACGLMGWKTDRFSKNMHKYGSAYHGGDGSIGFYDIKGLGTLDIDEEYDFAIAEAVFRAKHETDLMPAYFSMDA
jgi:CMP-N,N'-diacetyllegionaminic acid synthase